MWWLCFSLCWFAAVWVTSIFSSAYAYTSSSFLSTVMPAYRAVNRERDCFTNGVINKSSSRDMMRILMNNNENSENNNNSDSSNHHHHQLNSTSSPSNSANSNKKKRKRRFGGGNIHNHNTINKDNNSNRDNNNDKFSEIRKRIVQLEKIVSNQSVQIERLKQECDDLTKAASAFAQVMELLRQAGLTLNNNADPKFKDDLNIDSKFETDLNIIDSTSSSTTAAATASSSSSQSLYLEDSEIFGSAPNSVIDAADSAGAAILAAMLAGKRLMLVDVRDAELSRDAKTLVQFIELAILPVAAGLEGLSSERNRVKIVFPTVSQLLQYRKTMALAAPDVVALSTLGFESVEKKDNLVLLVAPSPDDEEGKHHMNMLLNPKDKSNQLTQPVVILNYHMLPLNNLPTTNFETVYHLRLLSVQYMTGDPMNTLTQDYVQTNTKTSPQNQNTTATKNTNNANNRNITTSTKNTKHKNTNSITNTSLTNTNQKLQNGTSSSKSEEDKALEAAMEHAHQMGVNQGITRAMVIRAYPRPWHVFVDTSPDADADFEVAATFDEEPTQDDVNYAIVECLEGSEREDELVAQQMQEALEAGQLNKISELLGGIPLQEIEDDDDNDESTTGEEDSDFDMFNEDSC